MSLDRTGRLAAVLGPTNTGKTYYAIERMLGHESGMIGFPLRLLARENYDRVVRLKGRGKVALVTGEEKIVPPGARYFLCTVESMPIDRPVAFLAIDEVQLCADAERGHVFTDRLLRARGQEETLLLGAETIRPLIEELVPRAEITTRPRFSKLSYAGTKKLSRLPPRSAVVAFSAAQVYSLAELMRRQRGGTAVVLGALSPRTRNAQVALFEGGDVDYLVATDAIGMGLNLSLDHVAFSALSKFDGRGPRRLLPAEVAQIAGRAGRHMNDGTFGTTGDLGAMDEATVAAIEDHRFESHAYVMWRNSDLDFRSPPALLKSLERHPPIPQLVRARDAEDHQALALLSQEAAIRDRASDRASVALLWEVCQVPDFQKILTDQHLGLLRQLYRYLTSERASLPEDWVAGQVKGIDRSEGDIDALLSRIAQVRTWTYVTHRADWVDDAEHWQGVTRALEDKLSDALHDRLTQRFVDRRTASLVRRLQGGDQLLAAVRADGEVLVEGEHVGRLEGFRFALDGGIEEIDAKSLLTASRRALASEIPGRVRALEQDGDEGFALDRDGQVTWRSSAVARLARGASALRPEIAVLPSDFLDGAQRERIRKRLKAWLTDLLERELATLYRAPPGALGAAARGLLFQLRESLGTLPRRAVADQLARASRADRKILGALGLRIGAQSLYFPELLKAGASALLARLWALQRERRFPADPPPGGAAYRPDPEPGFAVLDSAHLAIGYRCFRRDRVCVALRADRLERLSRALRKQLEQGAVTLTPTVCRQLGLGEEELAVVLPALGFTLAREPEGLSVQVIGGGPGKRPRRRDAPAGRARGKRRKADDSPFAGLRALKVRS